MHPVLAQQSRLTTYLIGWIPLAGVLSAVLALSGPVTWEEALALAPMSAVHAFLSLSTWYLCRAFPLDKTGRFRLLAILTLAATVTSSLWVFAGWTWSLLLARFPRFEDIETHYLAAAPLLLGIGILILFLAVSVHYLMFAFEDSREVERRSLKLRVLAREAELSALKAQMDPHFVFNSLNSISALTTRDPEGARRMCLLLADFLRKSLRFGGKQVIPLAEEIHLANTFLDIEKVRFGARLKVQTGIEETSQSCLVPSLLLQPLLENAVKHGIASLVEGGTISLEATNNGERLKIRVSNPCDPERPLQAVGGLGLRNTRHRLETRFGNDARLDVSESPGSYRVEISLPVVLPDGSREEARNDLRARAEITWHFGISSS